VLVLSGAVRPRLPQVVLKSRDLWEEVANRSAAVVMRLQGCDAARLRGVRYRGSQKTEPVARRHR
jgi:hypothetical protein